MAAAIRSSNASRRIAQQPIPGAIGAFRAMLDAGMFFAKGTGPHMNYNIQPAIEYLRAA